LTFHHCLLCHLFQKTSYKLQLENICYGGGTSGGGSSRQRRTRNGQEGELVESEDMLMYFTTMRIEFL
jgi:hypothetical protein